MPALFTRAVAQLSTVPDPARSLGLQKLTGTPMLEKLVFEQPWLSMLALVAAGLIAMWALSRQNQGRRGQAILAACVVLAGANYLVSVLVTTTRERISSLTREAIRHVIAGDAQSLDPLLRSDMVVHPFGITRDRVLQEVSVSMRGRYAVKSHSVLEMRTTQDSETAVRSQFHLRATPSQQLYELPVGSWWVLTWQKDATGTWLISRIECQQVDGVGNVENIRP